MNSLDTVFLVVLLVPLFISTWRTSLLGLALQGLLMSSMVVMHHPGLSWETAAELFDLGLVRMLVVPVLFYRLLKQQKTPARNDVIPPNMFFWALVVALVGLAFEAADRLHPGTSETQMHLAVGATGVLLGLFVLATQNGPFSQMVGALRLENAISFLELGTEHPFAPLPVRLGLGVLFLMSVLMFGLYLHRLNPAAAALADARSPAP